MGVTAKKYGVSVNFYRKLAIFGKTEKLTPIDFDRELKKIRTNKNSYTRSLCITDLKYEGHGQEI
jgi:hypothetical protein